MTTVAAIALALPALAQDQTKPLETGQEPTQQLEPANKALQQQTGQSAETTAPAQRMELPPATAEESPVTAPEAGPTTAPPEPGCRGRRAAGSACGDEVP